MAKKQQIKKIKEFINKCKNMTEQEQEQLDKCIKECMEVMLDMFGYSN